MSGSIDTTPAQDTHLFALEDEALLFQARTGRIFRLNPAASVIWQGVSAGIPIPDIVIALVESTNGHTDRIEADINLLISQWHKFGLLRGTDVTFANVRVSDTGPRQEIIYEYDEAVLPNSSVCPQIAFRIIDTDFILEVPASDIHSQVEPLLKHLSIDELSEGFIKLSVVRTNIRYVLLKDGVPIDWCPLENGIVPMVHANSLMAAYDGANCLIGVHSAAIEFRGKCILMPALSGSGKSTLTAALVNAGFKYLADDLVLLTDAPVRMRPVPVAIGLKRGVWSLLAPWLPALSTIATHRRGDDKLIRYFVPNNDGLHEPDIRPRPVHAIVFPKYEKNARLSLKSIKRAEALCRITDAGYDAQSGLTKDVVKQLIDWIAATPSFELHYDSLDQAINAITKVVE